MNAPPPPGTASPADQVARHLAAGRRASFAPTAIEREVPNAGRIARRQRLVRWSKRLLPAGALVLLGSVALWPEIDRSSRFTRLSTQEAAALRAITGEMSEPRYHGVDAHGRPYTITARSAHQVGPDEVDLTDPKADLVDNGAWLMLTADHGVYGPHSRVLDLSGHVNLYRDDGTLMYGPTATIDLTRSVVASNDWVRMQGPAGVLDAPGYIIESHDGIAQFRGPARLVINDNRTRSGTASGAGG